MTDVKLEDAERLAIELRVVSRMLSRDLKDAAAFSCDKAAALLRKIPELQKEIHYLKLPFSAVEKEFTSEGLDTNIAMNALCKRAESHKKHIARLEASVTELRQSLSSLTCESVDKQARLECTITRLEGEIETLRHERDDFRSTAQLWSDRITELEMSLEAERTRAHNLAEYIRERV
jgi:chromosome segregation ATPase